ncbi:hypothetical protein Igag_0509 [Ignisphaera aggregans DSM 17230]|uniref:Uncharacterized protein n=1 Tax=Ignisphaera aggregans (strain DSM 17230 / JCM 13409 / AQ1.S1) TaxID=583356 RepID=E0SRZ7_IGNAA|nr:hypothetical protein Igag_0509 [Ignisphaera aggregans DSM 17230]
MDILLRDYIYIVILEVSMHIAFFNAFYNVFLVYRVYRCFSVLHYLLCIEVLVFRTPYYHIISSGSDIFPRTAIAVATEGQRGRADAFLISTSLMINPRNIFEYI